MPLPCPKCGTTLNVREGTAGVSVPFPSCGTAVAVPRRPVAVPITPEPPRPAVAIPVTAKPPRPPRAIPVAEPARLPAPAEASAGRGVSVWVRVGAEVAVFVIICLIFACIGYGRDPDAPGISASRTARQIGAPVALLFIAGVELVVWMVKRQGTGREESRR